MLNNSPKVKSDTMKLTRSFLQGINKNNDHKIEIIDVIKKRINPCLSCFKCWDNLDGKIIQNDAQNQMLSNEVYIQTVNGQK